MSWRQRFRAWERRPEVAPWLAAFLWLAAVMNVVWGVQDFRDDYDESAKAQSARVSCEAKGGFYGSPVGAAKASDLCVKPTLVTALADR
jgi:hypothetical protein